MRKNVSVKISAWIILQLFILNSVMPSYAIEVGNRHAYSLLRARATSKDGARRLAEELKGTAARDGADRGTFAGYPGQLGDYLWEVSYAFAEPGNTSSRRLDAILRAFKRVRPTLANLESIGSLPAPAEGVMYSRLSSPLYAGEVKGRPWVALVAAWNPGQSTHIHNHLTDTEAEEEGVISVVQGEAEVVHFRREGDRIVEAGRFRLKAGEAAIVRKEEGQIHRVSNVGKGRLVMLDVYSPGLKRTDIFLPVQDLSTDGKESYQVEVVRVPSADQNQLLADLLAKYLTSKEVAALLGGRMNVGATKGALVEAQRRRTTTSRDGGEKEILAPLASIQELQRVEKMVLNNPDLRRIILTLAAVEGLRGDESYHAWHDALDDYFSGVSPHTLKRFYAMAEIMNEEKDADAREDYYQLVVEYIRRPEIAIPRREKVWKADKKGRPPVWIRAGKKEDVPGFSISDVRYMAHLNKMLGLSPTPLVPSETLSGASGRQVYWKLETANPTGSQKDRLRGYIYEEIRRRIRAGHKVKKLITASTGNEAIAVAKAGNLMKQLFPEALKDMEIVVYVSTGIVPEKEAHLRELGATIKKRDELHEEGEGFKSYEAARRFATFIASLENDNRVFVPHGTEVATAFGTIALEIVDQLQERGVNPNKEKIGVIIPMGSVGMAYGIERALTALGIDAYVVGVQPPGANSMVLSLFQGEEVNLGTGPIITLADGVGTSAPEVKINEVAKRFDVAGVVKEGATLLAAHAMHQEGETQGNAQLREAFKGELAAALPSAFLTEYGYVLPADVKHVVLVATGKAQGTRVASWINETGKIVESYTNDPKRLHTEAEELAGRLLDEMKRASDGGAKSVGTERQDAWGTYLWSMEDGTEIRRVDSPDELPAEVRGFWKDHDALYMLNNATLGYRAYIGAHRFLPFEGSLWTIGGTRMVKYDSEIAAMERAFFLSEDMSRKNAMAGLLWDDAKQGGVGGGKVVINFDPSSPDKQKVLTSVSNALGRLNIVFTGQDQNITEDDAVLMANLAPSTIVGPRGLGRGGVSPVVPTAKGIFLGMQAGMPFAFPKDPTLEGKRISIQGAGNVGHPLTEILLRETMRATIDLVMKGAKTTVVTVADKKPERIAALRKDFRDYIDQGRLVLLPIERAEEIYDIRADIFSPSATEWTLNETNIRRLAKAGVKYIAGSANDQLKRPEAGEREDLVYYLAQLLHSPDIDILYAPDYVINGGGLMGVASNLFGYNVDERLHRISENLNNIFTISRRDNIPTAIVADRIADELIQQATERRSFTGIKERWKVPVRFAADGGTKTTIPSLKHLPGYGDWLHVNLYRRVEDLPSDMREAMRSHWRGHEAFYEIRNDHLGYSAYIGIHRHIPHSPALRAKLVEGYWKAHADDSPWERLAGTGRALWYGQWTLGGTRVQQFETDAKAMTEVADLSAAMSRKSILSNLTLGGGKITIRTDFDPALSENTEKKQAIQTDLARIAEQLQVIITAVDVNTHMPDLLKMAEVAPHAIIGTGDPEVALGGAVASPITAKGVMLGMRAAVEVIFPDAPTLAGKTVALQGAGEVGRPVLHTLLREENVKKVYLAEPHTATVDVLRQEYANEIAAGRLEILSDPNAIYDVDADIFSPNAKPYILNSRTIPRMKFKLIAGAANIQLETPEDGITLHHKGIWYVPDYVINSGGLRAVETDLVGFDIEKNILEVYGAVKEVMERAYREHVPPSEMADRIADEKLDALAHEIVDGHSPEAMKEAMLLARDKRPVDGDIAGLITKNPLYWAPEIARRSRLLEAVRPFVSSQFVEAFAAIEAFHSRYVVVAAAHAVADGANRTVLETEGRRAIRKTGTLVSGLLNGTLVSFQHDPPMTLLVRTSESERVALHLHEQFNAEFLGQLSDMEREIVGRTLRDADTLKTFASSEDPRQLQQIPALAGRILGDLRQFASDEASFRPQWQAPTNIDGTVIVKEPYQKYRDAVWKDPSHWNFAGILGLLEGVIESGEMGALFWKFAKSGEQLVIAEVGTGNGPLTQQLLRLLREDGITNYKILATDVNPEWLASAYERYGSKKSSRYDPRIEFYLVRSENEKGEGSKDFESLAATVGGQKAHLVIGTHAIHLIGQFDRFAKGVRQALHPGGLIAFQSLNVDYPGRLDANGKGLFLIDDTANRVHDIAVGMIRTDDAYAAYRHLVEDEAIRSAMPIRRSVFPETRDQSEYLTYFRREGIDILRPVPDHARVQQIHVRYRDWKEFLTLDLLRRGILPELTPPRGMDKSAAEVLAEAQKEIIRVAVERLFEEMRADKANPNTQDDRFIAASTVVIGRLGVTDGEHPRAADGASRKLPWASGVPSEQRESRDGGEKRFEDFGRRLETGDETVIGEIVAYRDSLAGNDPNRQLLYEWLQHHESALSAKAIAAIGLNWSGVVSKLIRKIYNQASGNPHAAARQLLELATQGTYGGLQAPGDVQEEAKREVLALQEVIDKFAAVPLSQPSFPAVPSGVKQGVLILDRHGETSWSEAVLNKWAGWHDTKVTEKGRRDAFNSGERIHVEGLKFDVAYTSDLSRAQETLSEVLRAIGQRDVPVISDRSIRERDYGDMIGWNRKDVGDVFGGEVLAKWRRGYTGDDVRPPGGENLADVQERALSFLVARVLSDIASGKNVIVSAHGNSLRAFLIALREHTESRKLEEKEVMKLEVPLTTPIVITFDHHLHHKELWVDDQKGPADVAAFLSAADGGEKVLTSEETAFIGQFAEVARQLRARGTEGAIVQFEPKTLDSFNPATGGEITLKGPKDGSLNAQLDGLLEAFRALGFHGSTVSTTAGRVKQVVGYYFHPKDATFFEALRSAADGGVKASALDKLPASVDRAGVVTLTFLKGKSAVLFELPERLAHHVEIPARIEVPLTSENRYAIGWALRALEARYRVLEHFFHSQTNIRGDVYDSKGHLIANRKQKWAPGTTLFFALRHFPGAASDGGSRKLSLESIQDTALRARIQERARFLGADQIEVLDASDETRLLEMELKAGKDFFRTVDGNYFAFSHPEDTARSEARTFVTSRNPADKGLFNNWHDTDELEPQVEAQMSGADRGKTLYVVPYVAGPVNSPYRRIGVELTDRPYVALNIMQLYKVGEAAVHAINAGETSSFSTQVTGDLDHIKRGEGDERFFIDTVDEKRMNSFGSAYGGNAIIPKKFDSLRQAMYDARQDGNWLAEHMLIVGIQDLQTGETKYITAAFPSASGKTNLAMLEPPAALKDRYRVWLVSDDLAHLHVGSDGILRAINPEHGFFGVVPGTNWETNPNAMRAIGPNSGGFFTNGAAKFGEDPVTHEKIVVDLWWEGKGPKPEDVEGWLDWQGKAIKDRTLEEKEKPWAHPNSRVTTRIENAPNWIGHAAKLDPSMRPTDWDHPEGVPISAIFFGGRLAQGEPLIRQLPDVASGVYDGLVMGVETTAAAEGKAGQIRRDPFAQRPFFSYHEGDYVTHWLKVMGQLKTPPTFFHVNWFRKGGDGKFLWKGYGENLRPILWALERVEGKGEAVETPIGYIPTRNAINLEGLSLSDATWEKLSSVDPAFWKQEAGDRTEFFKSTPPNEVEPLSARLPEAVKRAHQNFVAGVEAYAADGAGKFLHEQQLRRAEQAIRRPIVGGNWKDKVPTKKAARALIKDIARQIGTIGSEIIVLPSYPHLAPVWRAYQELARERAIPKGRIVLGAQDVSAANPLDPKAGPRTGEIPWTQIKDDKVQYILTGHSERRHLLGETDAVVVEKTKLALTHGFKVILAVGETLEEREAGRTNEVIERQLRAVFSEITPEEARRVTIAYEPVWAIGTGLTPKPAEADAAHRHLRGVALDQFGEEYAAALRILYGGSMTPDNASSFIRMPNIDGGLIGGASLSGGKFNSIVNAIDTSYLERADDGGFKESALTKAVADLEARIKSAEDPRNPGRKIGEEGFQTIMELADPVSVRQQLLDASVDPTPLALARELLVQGNHTSFTDDYFLPDIAHRSGDLTARALNPSGIVVLSASHLLDARLTEGELADLLAETKDRLYFTQPSEDVAWALRIDYSMLMPLLEKRFVSHDLNELTQLRRNDTAVFLLDAIDQKNFQMNPSGLLTLISLRGGKKAFVVPLNNGVDLAREVHLGLELVWNFSNGSFDPQHPEQSIPSGILLLLAEVAQGVETAQSWVTQDRVRRDLEAAKVAVTEVFVGL